MGDAGRRDSGFTPNRDGGLAACLAGVSTAVPDGGVSFSFGDAGLEQILAALDLSPYTGTAEPGVVCGATTCAVSTVCCATCGSANCSTSGCGGLASPLACDGPEDCPGASQVCCFTVAGTRCAASADCTYALPQLDAGVADAGSLISGLLSSGTRACYRARDCRLSEGELCCSSGNLQQVELGLCLPAPLCLAGALP